MIFKSLTFFILLFLLNTFQFAAGDKNKKIEIGIDENLGSQIPLDLNFIDEDGKIVFLKNIVDKPTIFLFVYYECPGICTPLMSEVASIVNSINLAPGKDFQIVSLSFDFNEDYKLAARKKSNYLNIIKGEFPKYAWRFLTGDSTNIYSLTNSVGFMFKKEKDEFIHSGALIFVSPNGKITRYIPGTQFLPFDVKMAVLEASEGKVTPTIAKILKFCYKYDPEGKKYALNITRISGTGIIFFAIVFVIFFLVKPKKNKLQKEMQ